MSTACAELVSVPFHGDTIVCSRPEKASEPTVVLRPTCDAIGIDYHGQLQRLRRQAWARVYDTPTSDTLGRSQLMVCVDRKTFVMWLATIETSRLTNEAAAEKIRLYQCEAADILDRHFFGETEPEPTGIQLHIKQAREIVSILERQADQERRAIEQDQRITAIEAKTDVALAAVQDNIDRMTIKGFCNVNGIRLKDGEDSRVGAMLTKYCRDHGIEMGKVGSVRWGKENTYPIEILEKWNASRQVPATR